MWLYTSYAVQPHRSVASKNGDLRYHGPKYSVVEVASGVVLAVKLTVHPPSERAHAPGNPGTGIRGPCPARRPKLNDRLILACPQGRKPATGASLAGRPPASPPDGTLSSRPARPPLSPESERYCPVPGAGRPDRLSRRGRAGFDAYQNRCGAPAGAGAGGGPEHGDGRHGQISTHLRRT